MPKRPVSGRGQGRSRRRRGREAPALSPAEHRAIPIITVAPDLPQKGGRQIAVAAQNRALAGWNCEVTSPLRSMLLGLSVNTGAPSARLSLERSVQITFGAVVSSKK